MPARFRRAFTLIELLVVITVIAALAGLLLVVANTLWRGARDAKSGMILHQLALGLESLAADRGSLPVPAEHPLAASASPRSPFLRAGALLDATTDPALVGVPPERVAPAAADRVLTAEDRFADPQVPPLYGLPRAACGILGPPVAGITLQRRLPDPGPGAVIADPDDRERFPDRRHLIAPRTTLDEAAGLIERELVAAGVRDELAGLGALATGAGSPIRGGRLLLAEDLPEYRPGAITDGGGWYRAMLPGLHLVDAWGRPVLVARDASGLRLLSAGPDGVFRIDPGEDAVLQTAPDAAEPSGDDRDGARDNLTVPVAGG